MCILDYDGKLMMGGERRIEQDTITKTRGDKHNSPNQ